MNTNAQAVNEDAKAIAKLNKSFDLQQKSFLEDEYPDLELRLQRIQLVKKMFIDNRQKIQVAMHADYGNHPAISTDITEAGPVFARLEYVSQNLKKWMKPDTRPLNPLLGNSKAKMSYEPKGVVGIMSPWNFPIQLAVGPMIDALAAGNRAILKPSEVTSHCATLLEEMIRDTFDETVVTTATGGVSLAEHFSTLRWDHLLYTGNAHIARHVMGNCAKNLVPVTLELGGKSPAILDYSKVDQQAAKYIAGFKSMKRGQVCVNVDYCLVPEEKLAHFIELISAEFTKMGPDNASKDVCSIINERHYDRLSQLLAGARDAGSEIIKLGKDSPREVRNMPFTLIVNPPRDTRLMTEEIFGPLLPIITYKTMDDALAYVNAGEKPLGIYAFSNDRKTIDKISKKTRSGGLAINCVGGQVQAQLPFGGVGESGMGRHRGAEGFKEFSNPRGIMELGSKELFSTIMPPYDKASVQVVNTIFGSTKDKIKVIGRVLVNNLLPRFGRS
mgnify:CR=1 FL=1